MGSAVWVRASSVVPPARPAGLFTSEREQESDGPDNDDENNAYYQRILHRIILITRPELLHGAPSTGEPNHRVLASQTRKGIRVQGGGPPRLAPKGRARTWGTGLVPLGVTLNSRDCPDDCFQKALEVDTLELCSKVSPPVALLKRMVKRTPP